MRRALSNIVTYGVALVVGCGIMLVAGPYIGVWTLYWLVRLHG